MVVGILNVDGDADAAVEMKSTKGMAYIQATCISDLQRGCL